jgi:ABC-2 type transport system permease protein
MWNRIKALIIKETLAVLRDPRNRVALIAPPLLQLFLFSFTGTQEVKNIRIGIYTEDYGQAAFELVQRLAAAPNFERVYFVKSPEQLRELIDEQKAILGVRVAADFSRRLSTNNSPQIQLVLDGRKSTAAQIAQGYISSIVEQFGQDLNQQISNQSSTVIVQPRNWFNPNLDYLWFTVPSLVVIITLQVTMNVTTMSVPREREMGTFDQLLIRCHYLYSGRGFYLSDSFPRVSSPALSRPDHFCQLGRRDWFADLGDLLDSAASHARHDDGHAAGVCPVRLHQSD